MGGNDVVSLPPPNDVVPAEELDDDDQEDDYDDDLVNSNNSSSTLDRVKLADSPILLLVYFHEAFRAEVADLRRAVADAAERGNHAPDFVFELLRRFEFLKLACKYHCVAEDEVIFLALDVHVRNVACTYSLEHKSIDGLFDSIFFRLNAMLELENSRNISTKPFRELMLCIGTIQSFISKHMLKEEKQVFPLLVEHISMKEQASLVWQFMCSVPIVLLEDMFPWMLSFLTPQQQLDVTNCIRDIVPEEKSLQEVILSWVGTNNGHTETKNSLTGGVSDMKTLLKSYSCRRSFSQCWSSTTSFTSDLTHNPLDGLQFWHRAINKDLTSLLSELSQAKKSSSFSNLDNIIIQLKFLADIITFYSNALERLFWPVLNQLVHGHMAPSVAEAFPSESHIERLQMLLYHTAQHHANPSEFVDKLCCELDSFVVEISKQFSFQEAEVFPVISRNCSRETQGRIMYVSVHMMPLGLLRCVITWFSSHLSEEQCRFVLNTIKQEEAFGAGGYSLASLLHEWLRAGCSGKISVEKFGNNLQQMFKSRRPFFWDQNKDSVVGSSSSDIDAKTQEKPDTSRLQILQSSTKSKSCLMHCSSTYGQASRKCETPYSSVINLHIYFPETIKMYHPFSEILGGETVSGSALIDPKPMDFIFYFHKALKADLEYLVFGSLQLAHNAGFLDEFRRRFDLIQFLYQIHSDAEDEVAFPALEQMGKVVNISHSYTMDHKLEVEHFESVSHILDKLSELKKSSIGEAYSEARMRRHNQLCLRLYHKCESMHKLLTDHIHREEVELWPLFRECFSIKEQERIVGSILGRTKAEILQDMIPWLMGSLTQEEQHTMMSLWRQVTRHTMFDEWLREWWERYQILPDAAEEVRVNAPSLAAAAAADPLEIVFDYIAQTSTTQGEANPRREEVRIQERDGSHSQRNVDDKAKDSHSDFDPYGFGLVGHRRSQAEPENTACEVKPGAFLEAAQKSKHHDLLMKMSQEDLEAVILKVTRDPALDSQKKSYIIQNLLVSRWIVRHHSQSIVSSGEQEFPGKHPSYKDPVKRIFGCEHYKRNSKLVAPCCNQLYTCLKCHDEIADHVIDRKSVTEMMCMKCLKIQPIGQTCSTPSCEKFSMARYYCRICKIFEDERVIYHCPYCNLCRIGKGLGIDYFHCMNCNACMSRTLFVHVCREKCLMDNCPICHEDLFTSTLPVKALQCGHLMHSKCFEAYTCTNYTCPICGKSLGDMQVYFQMLDALLAEDQIPAEYADQTQVILCSDCGKRGEASFHWRYHKCPLCGSYNTRVL